MNISYRFTIRKSLLNLSHSLAIWRKYMGQKSNPLSQYSPPKSSILTCWKYFESNNFDEIAEVTNGFRLITASKLSENRIQTVQLSSGLTSIIVSKFFILMVQYPLVQRENEQAPNLA